MTPIKISRLVGFGAKPAETFTTSPVVIGTDPASDIRFEGQSLHVEHELHVLVERVGDARRRFGHTPISVAMERIVAPSARRSLARVRR